MIKIKQGRAGTAYSLTLNFTDEFGNPATVISANWSLYDGNRKLVNNKANVNIPSPQSVHRILIPATDMGDNIRRTNDSRIVVVVAEYISAITAQIEQQTQWAEFSIDSPGKLEQPPAP